MSAARAPAAHAAARACLRLVRLAAAAPALAVWACSGGGPSEPSPLASPAGPGSGQAHLAAAPDGEAVLSWLEPAAGGHELKVSRLGGDGWSAPRTIAAGEELFVNWADFPSVVPITEDVWAAHWLERAAGSFASYDIAYAVSGDGGRSFTDGRTLNADGVLTEHGFVSLFPWDGAIGAIWLDGRRLAEQFETGGFDPDGPPVGVSLRYARIGYDGHVGERGEIDELVCDCCQTDAAPGPDGPIIVYRDRSPEEIRDVVARRHDGSAWQAPLALGDDGWHIEGCPVNGPAMAADGEVVAAAWFTAADDRPRVRFARSADGGERFGEPVDIDADGPFGQVDVVLLDGGDAVVSWWRRAGAGEIALAARRVAADGSLGEIRSVAVNAIGQPLDIPQMVAAGDRLVFAWTDAQDESVRTAILDLR